MKEQGATPTVDEVFKALADPSRRQLLDRLHERSGQNLRELCEGLDMARQSVSKHLAILEAAGLVTTVKRGREKLHYVNAAPISEIGERWIRPYDRDRVDALADLKRALEEPSMDKPTFAYTTYIRTTPEQLWRALTDPAWTSRYWGLTFDTDWAEGSEMVWHNHGVRIEDPEQVVLASEPFTRLSYSWHRFTPELGARFEFDEERMAALDAEPRSKVTFEIEEQEHRVKLTVLHEGLAPDGVTLQLISGGWPQVLASLKTILETGAALDEPVG